MMVKLSQGGVTLLVVALCLTPVAHSGILDNTNYFEGDMVVTDEFIERAYGYSKLDQNSEKKRGAVRYDTLLDFRWPDGILQFAFNSSVDEYLQNLTFVAIEEIERESCIRFVHVDDTYQGDHVLFTDQGDGCASFVGRTGGQQTITLPDFGNLGTCQHHGIIIHEILHALGFLHEQSRPDRDRYINVNEEYFAEPFDLVASQFLKLCECFYDYQGGEYDYGSLMHYGTYDFSNGSGPTIEVNNQQAYERQGSPTIGQRVGLSPGDILQLNRLYNCPAARIRGELRVFIKSASEVPYYAVNRPLSNDYTTGLYALVTSKDEIGQTVTKRTQSVFNTQNPIWNEYLSLGSSQWRTFQVSIREEVNTSQPRGNMSREGGFPRDAVDCNIGLDASVEVFDTATDYVVMCRKTIWVESVDANETVYSGDLEICIEANTCVNFEYEFRPNNVPCKPNPCRNGGTCVHTFGGFRCECTGGYTGRQCDELSPRSCDPRYICTYCANFYNSMCLQG